MDDIAWETQIGFHYLGTNVKQRLKCKHEAALLSKFCPSPSRETHIFHGCGYLDRVVHPIKGLPLFVGRYFVTGLSMHITCMQGLWRVHNSKGGLHNSRRESSTQLEVSCGIYTGILRCNGWLSCLKRKLIPANENADSRSRYSRGFVIN